MYMAGIGQELNKLFHHVVSEDGPHIPIRECQDRGWRARPLQRINYLA